MAAGGAEGADLAGVGPAPEGRLIHAKHAGGVPQGKPASRLGGLDSLGCRWQIAQSYINMSKRGPRL
jgi:hypothetical protein